MGHYESGFDKAEACMSSSSPAADIVQLRREVSLLTERVRVLEEQLGQRPAVSLTSSPVTVNYLGASGTALSSEIPPFPEFSTPEREPSQAVVRPGGLPTEAERLAIAEEVGRFLRRSLQGDYRGGSGRDRLRLQSRVYILVRDFSGRLYNPVEIYHRFVDLKPKVKSGDSAGDSIFIGLPTVWEAKAAVAAAQLRWPDGY